MRATLHELIDTTVRCHEGAGIRFQTGVTARAVDRAAKFAAVLPALFPETRNRLVVDEVRRALQAEVVA